MYRSSKSAMDDFFAPSLRAPRGIPGIDHEFGIADNSLVVVVRMVCCDEDTIVAGEALGSKSDRTLIREIVVAHFEERGKVRIVVIDESAALGEQLQKL